jgi:hypothetical protein
VNTIVTIVPFLNFRRTTFYSIQIDGEERSETMDFMLRYADHEEHKEDFDEIRAFIKEWGEDGISREARRRLRHENHAKALPPYHTGSSMVRLYCCLLGENVMILGNGGHKVKPSDRHQDSPHLKPHFDFFNIVTAKIDRMLAQRELWVEGNELKGDMEIWL